MIPTLVTDPIKALTSFLKKENLQDKKILLMVSGGVDSMVLLHTAVQITNPQLLHIFHLNHATRETSEDDALFVASEAKKLGIACTVEKLNEIPTENKEAFWRKKRQTLSQSTAQKNNCETILTAHHATDLTETMIFHLTKGCGLSGLAPFDLSTKPFWNISKEALLQYAEENHIEWREDTSNADTDFSRNKIRHEVLPALRTLTPNLEQVFVKERSLFGELEIYLEKQVFDISQQGSINKTDFLELPKYLQISLLYFLGKNTSLDEISDCLRWITEGKEGGKEKQIGESVIKLKNNVLSW